jgi:hypothetical protein
LQALRSKVIKRIDYGVSPKPPSFDEQIRVIYAEDHLHAFQKARLIGDQEAMHTKVEIDKLIKWKFIDIAELYLFEPSLDGAEMYSLKTSYANADAYIRETQKKALSIFDEAVTQFTG